MTNYEQYQESLHNSLINGIEHSIKDNIRRYKEAKAGLVNNLDPFYQQLKGPIYSQLDPKSGTLGEDLDRFAQLARGLSPENLNEESIRAVFQDISARIISTGENSIRYNVMGREFEIGVAKKWIWMVEYKEGKKHNITKLYDHDELKRARIVLAGLKNYLEKEQRKVWMVIWEQMDIWSAEAQRKPRNKIKTKEDLDSGRQDAVELEQAQSMVALISDLKRVNKDMEPTLKNMDLGNIQEIEEQNWFKHFDANKFRVNEELLQQGLSGAILHGQQHPDARQLSPKKAFEKLASVLFVEADTIDLNQLFSGEVHPHRVFQSITAMSAEKQAIALTRCTQLLEQKRFRFLEDILLYGRLSADTKLAQFSHDLIDKLIQAMLNELVISKLSGDTKEIFYLLSQFEPELINQQCDVFAKTQCAEKPEDYARILAAQSELKQFYKARPTPEIKTLTATILAETQEEFYETHTRDELRTPAGAAELIRIATRRLGETITQYAKENIQDSTES